MSKQKTDFQVVISGQDKLTAPIMTAVKTLNKLTAPIDKFTRKAKTIGDATGFNKLTRSVGRTGKSLAKVNASIGITARRLRNLTLTGTLVAGTMFLIGKNIADTGLEFEKAETKFRNFGGEAGVDFLDTLRKMGQELPFTTGQFVTMADTVRGLNPNMAIGKIEEVTRALGDMAALSGADIGQLSLSVSQSLGKGKIETRDIKELAARGINIKEAMIKVINKHNTKEKLRGLLGVDKLDVVSFDKAMKKGMITSKIFEKAFLGLNKKGQTFFNGMKIFGETVGGQITRAAGAFEELKLKIFGTGRTGLLLGSILKRVFNRVEGVLKRVGLYFENNRDSIKKWITEFEKTIPTTDEIIKGIKDLKKQAVALWKDLKPLRNIIKDLNKEFGGLKVLLGAITIVLSSSLISSLGSLALSLTSVGGGLIKLISTLGILLGTGFLTALAVFFPNLAAGIGLYSAAIASAILPTLGIVAAVMAVGVALGWLTTRGFMLIQKVAAFWRKQLDSIIGVLDNLSKKTNGWLDWFIKPIQYAITQIRDLMGWMEKFDFKRTDEKGVLGTAWDYYFGDSDVPTIGADPVDLAAVRNGVAGKDGKLIVEVVAAPGTDAVVKDASPNIQANTGSMLGAH